MTAGEIIEALQAVDPNTEVQVLSSKPGIGFDTAKWVFSAPRNHMDDTTVIRITT